MSQQELLMTLARTLRDLRIPFMLTGSFAAALQGHPRATHDVDLVVELSGAQVGPLLRAFGPPRYYLDEHAVKDAMARQGMFNLLDTETGDKVDFWMLTDSAFDAARFARRKHVDFHGVSLDVSTPEDTILQKLAWSREIGGSEKQFADAVGVARFHVGLLDERYMARWATALGVEELWERAQASIDAQDHRD